MFFQTFSLSSFIPLQDPGRLPPLTLGARAANPAGTARTRAIGHRVPPQHRSRPPRRESRARRGPASWFASPSPSSQKSRRRPKPGNPTKSPFPPSLHIFLGFFQISKPFSNFPFFPLLNFLSLFPFPSPIFFFPFFPFSFSFPSFSFLPPLAGCLPPDDRAGPLSSSARHPDPRRDQTLEGRYYLSARAVTPRRCCRRPSRTDPAPPSYHPAPPDTACLQGPDGCHPTIAATIIGLRPSHPVAWQPGFRPAIAAPPEHRLHR
jgi:hypothetical protein